MKKFLSLVLLLFFFASCSDPAPQSVAEAYLAARHGNDYKKAQEYAGPELQAFLKMMAALDADKEKEPEKKSKFKFKFIREEVDNETVLVFYEDQQGKERNIKLVLWENKWRVVTDPLRK